MALQRDPVTFGRLKALSMRKRMEIAQAPDVAMGLLSSLTPTDLALLFPTYYKKILPDVSGFRAAISKQSSEQQAAAQGSLLQRLSAVEATAGVTSRGSISRPWVERTSAAKMPAQLSPEQAAAFQKIQQGAIGLNSPDAKFFNSLSASQLASIGITKGKDNTGAEVYQYQAPEVSREEAVSRLKTAKTSQSKNEFFNSVYNEAYNQAKGQFAHPEVIARLAAIQASHESAYGRKAPGNNYFGIKGAGQSFATHEEVGGRSVGMQQSFRTYGGLSDSVAGYLKLMKGNRYRDVATASSIEEAMNAQGRTGYATDSSYAQKLYNIHKSNGAEIAIAPTGPGGQYSEEQINKMMDQLKTEKNETRRQQLANLISSSTGGQMSPETQTVVTGKVTYGQVKDFSQYIMYEHSRSQCGIGTRTLAGHMYGHGEFLSQGIGNEGAGSLSRGNNYFQKSGLFHQPKHISDDLANNQAYLDSLPIGTVVSQTGGKSVGHVQIKIGPNRWASDFNQQHFLSNGYSNFTVHMPNEAGLAALSKNGVEQNVSPLAGDQKVVDVAPLRMTQRPGEAPEPPPPPPPATPPSYTPEAGDSPDLGGQAPTAAVDKKPIGYQQPQEQLNPQAVRDIQAQQGTMPPGPATPKQEAPRVTSGSYKLNMKAFREAVKNDPSNTYPGWMIDMASDQDIIDGFNKDARVKAAGVNIADGKLTVKDMSNPEVKAVIEGAQKSGALKAIEQAKPKVEAPKEAPKPPPEPPKPTATVEQRTSRAGEAPEPTPPPPPEPAPKPVQGYSDGGSFTAPGDINFYKVDKQDDMVAVNPQTQKPIATMQSGETLSRGDGRVDVTPQSKSNDAGPVPDTNVTQLSNIMSSFSDALSNIGKNTQTIPKVSQETATNHPNLIGDTNSQIVNQQKFSPSYDRAMHRISRGTEPTGSFDHFSYGNK